jgi:hypothetical protein
LEYNLFEKQDNGVERQPILAFKPSQPKPSLFVGSTPVSIAAYDTYPVSIRHPDAAQPASSMTTCQVT